MLGSVDVCFHPSSSAPFVARDFNQQNDHVILLDQPRCTECMFRSAKSGGAITAVQDESAEHATRLLSPFHTLYNQLMPRVRMLVIRFAPPDSFFFRVRVGTFFYPQGQGWKVVQVNIQDRERFLHSVRCA